MLLVLAWWGISVDGGVPLAAVLAAGGLLTAHVAALVASYGPGDLPVDGDVARTWLGRALLVFLIAPVVWLLATVLRDQPEPPGIWLAGLVAAIAAALVASVAFAVRSQGSGVSR
jgi:phosphatidylglycerophosphate synthase